MMHGKNSMGGGKFTQHLLAASNMTVYNIMGHETG